MKQIVGRAAHVALAALVAIALGAATAAAEEFSAKQKAEIERIIGEYVKQNPEFIADYLRRNPEILLEVSEILRSKQLQAEREKQAEALAALRERIERHPMTPVTGNPDGDVTLVEFFDYNCPYCKRVFAYMTELAREDANLRVVWKEFPILGPVSHYAARAAMAADRQGKYMEFHGAMMEGGRLASEQQVLATAESIGIDVERLLKDMEDPAIEAYLNETIQLANAIGITGTPGFVVGDEIISGAISKDNMKKVIELTRRNGS